VTARMAACLGTAAIAALPLLLAALGTLELLLLAVVRISATDSVLDSWSPITCTVCVAWRPALAGSRQAATIAAMPSPCCLFPSRRVSLNDPLQHITAHMGGARDHCAICYRATTNRLRFICAAAEVSVCALVSCLWREADTDPAPVPVRRRVGRNAQLAQPAHPSIVLHLRNAKYCGNSFSYSERGRRGCDLIPVMVPRASK